MLKRIVVIILVMFSLPFIIGVGDPMPKADFVYVEDAEYNSRDPQRMTYLADIRLARRLFETLVDLDFNDLSRNPGAAERWDVSEDGRTYTFYIREDAYWSNGDRLTSHDYIYAWRRAIIPDTASGYAFFLFVIDGAHEFYSFREAQLEAYVKQTAETGGSDEAARRLWEEAIEKFDEMVKVRAIDDKTLEVTIKQRTEYFLDLVAFATYMPVHAASVEVGVSYNAETGTRLDDPTYWNNPKRLISNGPYVLTKRKFRQYSYLTANPNYWNRDALKNQSVMARIISDDMAMQMAYNQGVVDYVPLISTGMAHDLVAQDRDDVHVVPLAGTYIYNFNCNPKLNNGQPNPLADWRVRRALSAAIDRKQLGEMVTRLNEPPAYSFVPPGSCAGYEPPVEASTGFDPQVARDLMAEAGFADGSKITGLSILYNTGSGHERIAQAVKNTWKEHLGVIVTLEGVESKISSQRSRSQDYTIRRAGWYGDYADPTSWLDIRSSEDENNTTKWSNLEYDALLVKAATTGDPSQRMLLLREAEAIMLKECPQAVIFHYVGVSMFDPDRVKGLELNAWTRDRFEQVDAVDRGKIK
jgi:oligopeptide transport system substrate-binding protein